MELLSFTGGCDGAPALNWSTGSEQNSSHFDVQRSTDLEHWEELARIPAAGHSAQRVEYAFRDPNAPPSAVLYYRLHQVDLDDAREYFGPVAVSNCRPDDVLVAYPNPTSGHVRVRASTAGDQPLVLELRDACGRLVRSEQCAATGGFMDHAMDLHGCGSGSYLLTLRRADGTNVGQTRVQKDP